jgi:hypothetical protein
MVGRMTESREGPGTKAPQWIAAWKALLKPKAQEQRNSLGQPVKAPTHIKHTGHGFLEIIWLAARALFEGAIAASLAALIAAWGPTCWHMAWTTFPASWAEGLLAAAQDPATPTTAITILTGWASLGLCGMTAISVAEGGLAVIHLAVRIVGGTER